MYEVGSWFVWLMNGAILAIIGFFIAVFTQVKRNQYAKDAVGKMIAEIWLPSGYAKRVVVPIDDNAKTVEVGNFIYLLNPEKRRFSKYPLEPFMGLQWLQGAIRIESWYQDNPEPIQPSYEVIDKEKVIYYDTVEEDGNTIKVVVKNLVATSLTINAIQDEHTAVTTAMEIQEMHAQQQELVKALANQPNKNYVYIGLVLAIGVGIAAVAMVLQLMSALGVGF